MLVIREVDKSMTENLYNLWNTFRPKDSFNPIEIIKPFNICFEFMRIIDKKELCVGAFINDNLIGCCSLFPKNYEHMSIGGIGRMAVDFAYRKQGIAQELLAYLIDVMYFCEYDISILWASVLKVYEKVGYKAFHKNMMCLPIKKQLDVYMLSNLLNMSEKIGAW